MKIRSENGASSGTENQTSNQSQNHTHTLTNGTAKVTMDPGSVWNPGTAGGKYGYNQTWSVGGATLTATISGRTDNANQGHTHNMYLFGDTETRSDNFTKRIWKRIN